ncbi:MAG TPA: SDR family NAD(P)-dependent oxidoreductase [Burkholderiales bacterium]|nr:SDR family NAD(P)-dependent oxidoreductase [Burkholderiales bacterium]
MQQHLKGRSAIVTGAGRGIGREIALLLAKQGAKVAVCDPGLDRGGKATEERVADEVVGLIRQDGGTAIALYDSVADYKKAGEMVATTVAEFGGVDLMINVAGILRERMIWNMSEEDFDQVVAVHLKGMWNMSHHSIKHMRARGFGRIVNFSSSAFKGSVGQCNYAAAKAGIIGLSRTIAQEAYKFGITCNAVCPSADTRMTLTEEVKANRKRKFEAGITSAEEYARQTQPRGPEYIAPFVAYLCTDEAYYLNGQTFHTEKGELSNYYFGETMNQITKEEDGGMFSIEELMKKVPEMMRNATVLVPAVPPAEAQKYVKTR